MNCKPNKRLKQYTTQIYTVCPVGSPSLSQASPAGDEASKDSWFPSCLAECRPFLQDGFSSLQRSVLILTRREKHAEQRDASNWRNCPNWTSTGAYHPYITPIVVREALWSWFYVSLSEWDMHAPWQVGQRPFIVTRRRHPHHHLPHPLPLNSPAGSPAFRQLWRRSCLRSSVEGR